MTLQIEKKEGVRRMSNKMKNQLEIKTQNKMSEKDNH